MIYSGLEMKMPLNFIRKLFKNLRKQIGDNPYMARMRKYINLLGSTDLTDEIAFGNLLGEDLSDCETRKKILATYKVALAYSEKK